MGGFDTSNQLAILAGARAPAWEAQPTQNEATDTLAAPLRPPSLATDGVAPEGALYALVRVLVRVASHRRRGVVTIGTFDATSSYTVTLGGTAFTSTTPADLATLLSDLATAIDANANYSASVVGSTVVFYRVPNGTDPGDADYSIACSRSGGTGTLTVTADPATATLRFWAVPAAASGYTAPEGWSESSGPTGPTTLSVDYGGALFALPAAGRSRLYVEVDALAGHGSDSAGTGGTIAYATPVVMIGPCILENA